jgi:hypothetical protein
MQPPKIKLVLYVWAWGGGGKGEHYTISRKFTGSILDEEVEFFPIFIILPAELWSYGFLNLLQKWVSENRCGEGGKVRPEPKAGSLSAICEPII